MLRYRWLLHEPYVMPRAELFRTPLWVLEECYLAPRLEQLRRERAAAEGTGPGAAPAEPVPLTRDGFIEAMTEQGMTAGAAGALFDEGRRRKEMQRG